MNGKEESPLGEDSLPELDSRISQLEAKKASLNDEIQKLSQEHISLQRRNDTILNQLQKELTRLQLSVADYRIQKKKTEAECQSSLSKHKISVDAIVKEAELVLIGHRKEHNHLIFNLTEKHEVSEQQKTMSAKLESLIKEEAETRKTLNEKSTEFDRVQMTMKNEHYKKLQYDLEQRIKAAKDAIKKERYETLKDAEKNSQLLVKQVDQSQKIVVNLRNRYNQLIEEGNNLEMQLTEAKLVTQLTNTQGSETSLQKLRQELASIEDAKLRFRTAPEANNRRQMTLHLNTMKRKQNELSGFKKLNRLKRNEMNQLRSLASTVIEQRSALILFFNETLTLLRKEIAGSIQQKGLPFRTPELILCHTSQQDQELFGRTFQASDPSLGETQETLKFFETLYARFTGVPPPRNDDEGVDDSDLQI